MIQQEQDNTVLIPMENKDSISSLPKTFLEALSAIQEQNFVEAELDDPEMYGELFTYKHKLAFIKVGFLTAVGDSFLTILGMIFFNLGRTGALPMFSMYPASNLDLSLAFFIAILPYLIMGILIFHSFRKIAGTISKKMAFWLSLGFGEGMILTTIILFVIGFGIATEKAIFIYNILSSWEKIFPVLSGMSDFFWNHIRYAVAKTTWEELWITTGMVLFIFECLFSKIFWLKKDKQKKG